MPSNLVENDMFHRRLLLSAALTTKAVITSEIWVDFYQTKHRNLPENCHLHTQHANMKPHPIIAFLRQTWHVTNMLHKAWLTWQQDTNNAEWPANIPWLQRLWDSGPSSSRGGHFEWLVTQSRRQNEIVTLDVTSFSGPATRTSTEPVRSQNTNSLYFNPLNGNPQQP